ncbi:glycerol-3-phosphate dehydrogenase/oxidase [Sulfoacidibacillus thermotolerans]|uniref:Aerobic glycerol-3-phosphate dehydrogenase n=1 Tax=Sulfoacidibacillus thermotolerans TaxID=1765684 RepID=A0A2U3D9T4_SULT2|nr:FAD-dependent oxidoreductase [Sulfoacidibacillus thermotolerans]PWI58023.1 glycerol-3-phosphate dehydrogenase [Sulfoacidibacillus thermotolerans]
MAVQFSMRQRNSWIEQLQKEKLDLLIVGGGVTGAGILLDAKARGMTAALVEMQDFAAGTSSRSTKLVHGGLRYLKQGAVALVAEVGRERAIVYENAPHVTTPLWMLLPIYRDGSFGRLTSSLGLSLYDRLAGVKSSERRKMLSISEVMELEPLLRQEGLRGAGYYVEYRTDDARLTLEIVKAAVERGAYALNYTQADAWIYENNQIAGAKVNDLLTGTTFSLRAQYVINATGPWVDRLRDWDHSKFGKTLHLTKGVHLVVDGQRFPLKKPVYFDVPDGRMIFAIPRDGKTYIGTTDTDYEGDLLAPRVTQEDRAYLLSCVNSVFPSVALTAKDVESLWAGIRPLIQEEGKKASEISRKDEIFVSQSGLITIAGGKLTGYRKMAEKVVTRIVEKALIDKTVQFKACNTDKISLSGGDFGGSEHFADFIQGNVQRGVQLGVSASEAEKLVHRYGTNIEKIYELLQERGEEAQQFQLPAEVFGALLYGLLYEMVVTPSDFFIRRTGAMYFNIQWVKQWQDPVMKYMAHFFEWSEEQVAHFRNQLQQHIREATEVV